MRKPPRGREPHPLPAMPISSARIGLVMLLVAETMFFAGLIGAYLVFRFGKAVWPPPDLPRLPLAITWANTMVLCFSGLTMLAALRAVRRGDTRRLLRLSVATLVLGTVFVGVQGAEWVRLIEHGLTLSAGTYGATFYVLIGAHAAHVVAAVLWLGIVSVGTGLGRFDGEHHTAVELCTMYWSFVCGLWLVLFALVYQ
jgi:heme/copper-type cytochrome/quinol oxidase subunit 3